LEIFLKYFEAVMWSLRPGFGLKCLEAKFLCLGLKRPGRGLDSCIVYLKKQNN